MKKVYDYPVTEVTMMNACSVLCASGDPVLSAPSSDTKDKPMGAY